MHSTIIFFFCLLRVVANGRGRGKGGGKWAVCFPESRKAIQKKNKIWHTKKKKKKKRGQKKKRENQEGGAIMTKYTQLFFFCVDRPIPLLPKNIFFFPEKKNKIWSGGGREGRGGKQELQRGATQLPSSQSFPLHHPPHHSLPLPPPSLQS